MHVFLVSICFIIISQFLWSLNLEADLYESCHDNFYLYRQFNTWNFHHHPVTAFQTCQLSKVLTFSSSAVKLKIFTVEEH